MLEVLRCSPLISLVLLAASSTVSGDVVLAERGQARAVIVLERGAPAPEATAASELSAYLKRITGAEFNVVSDAVAERSRSARIFVGQSRAVKARLPGFDWNSLDSDGIAMKTVGGDLILAGGRPRGTLYAVYSFLEDVAGCRWWTSSSEFVPSKPTLRIGKLDVTYTPPFIYRETYWRDVIDRNSGFSVRLKLNGLYQPIPPELGSHYVIIGGCHTFWQFIPAETYFKTHPEWFSEVNGKRIPDGQLCLTNPELKAEMVKVALARIAENPGAGQISISQNDNNTPCQCANCAKVVAEEGGESGLMIRFVNSVAEEIEKKYPDFLVDTLAYMYTRHTPKFARPRKNVVVRLCSIECNFARPLDDPSNVSFYKDLKDWAAISPRLFIWDYNPNFSDFLVPHPNFRVLAPNIRIFAANKVIGDFEQGDGSNENANFNHLKLWLVAHLLWNPRADARKLTSEFLRGYYGTAAPFLQKYIDLTCDAVERANARLTCFSPDDNYLKLKDMNAATVLFNNAEAAVKDSPELLRRVQTERLALDHAWLLNTHIDRFTPGSLYPKDYKAMAERFVTNSRAWGAGFIQNETPIPVDYAETLEQKGAIKAGSTR